MGGLEIVSFKELMNLKENAILLLASCDTVSFLE